MQNISSALYTITRWPSVVAVILIYGLFLAFVMTPHAEDVQQYAGDWGAPDSHLFYTPETLYAQVDNWNAKGKQQYINFRRGADPVWAFVYTAFLVTLISYALGKATPPRDPRRLLNLVPILPMFADLLENALGISLMTAHPERIEWLAWTTTLVTTFKWASLAVAHLILLYAITIAIAAKLSGSQTNIQHRKG